MLAKKKIEYTLRICEHILDIKKKTGFSSIIFDYKFQLQFQME